MRFSDRRFFPTCDCGRICPIGMDECARCMPTPTVTRGRGSNKGRNAVGAAHKPERSYTRRAKRQNSTYLGMCPRELQAYRP